MQKARLIVAGAPESCRKNFEITCYGEHISFRFCSGSRGNKIAVLVCEGTIHVVIEERTWKQAMIDFFKRQWQQFLGIKLIVALRAALTDSEAAVSYLPLEQNACLVSGFHNLRTGSIYTLTLPEN
jgi:hypothetical protein